MQFQQKNHENAWRRELKEIKVQQQRLTFWAFELVGAESNQNTFKISFAIKNKKSI